MGMKVFWKSVIRKTGSLLLLLALLIAASFGFMLRTVEYLSVSGEIDRISESYRPIGIFSNEDYSDNGYSVESEVLSSGLALLEESPYLEFVNRKRYCTALLSDIYNADLDGLSSDRRTGLGVRINDILVWAEVEDVKITNDPSVFRYDFRVKETVYGYPDYMGERKKIVTYFSSTELGIEEEAVFEQGKIYLVKARLASGSNTFRGNVLTFELLPLAENRWFVESGIDAAVAEKYVDADAVLQEQNRHAMYVTTAVDMNFLPEVQDAVKTIHLEEGRWLNYEDHKAGNKVCMVTKDFAEARDLQVGDTLKMTLQDWISSYSVYVTDMDETTWEGCDKTEVELEIVGLFSHFMGGAANHPGFYLPTVNRNDLYIPDSLLPEEYFKDEPLWAPSFSFVLSSPKGTDAFIEETGKKLEELGIPYSFMENNWDGYYASAKGLLQGARYNLLVFTVVIVIALIAVAFLYTWQRKKEIAIARAIGIPARDAALGACLPMMVFGAFGIFAGSAFAWKYGLDQAEQTLTELDSGGHAGLSLLWFAGVCLLVWFVLSLTLLLGGFLYAHKPVLEILQGSPVRGKEKAAEKDTTSHTEAASVSSRAAEAAPPLQNEIPEKAAYRSHRASLFPVMAGFVWHHLAHISLRLVCVLLAAAVFVTASGWLRMSIRRSEEKLDRLYRTTTVEASIARANPNSNVLGGTFIYGTTVQRICDTGFVQDVYLEARLQTRMGKADKSTGMKRTLFVGTKDIEQFMARDWINEPRIHYGDGYGADLFRQECIVKDDGSLENVPAVIVPESIWEKWNLQAGDALWISDSINHLVVDAVVGGYYSGGLEGFEVDKGIAVMAPLSLLEMLELNLDYYAVRFTLDPDKNRELSEFVEQAEREVTYFLAGTTDLKLVVWDSELRQVVEPMERNISLMKLLYPIANIVSFLIAAGLAVLLLFQRRREAAILRVMGVGKLSVRLALTCELLILNLVGVLLGLVLIFAITRVGDAAVMGIAAGAYFAGGIIGAAAGCILITRERPLELLQVKE